LLVYAFLLLLLETKISAGGASHPDEGMKSAPSGVKLTVVLLVRSDGQRDVPL
jgi:hypothetical protein